VWGRELAQIAIELAVWGRELALWERELALWDVDFALHSQRNDDGRIPVDEAQVE